MSASSFYRISVQERACDYCDSRTNLFDHFETYDFSVISTTPKAELKTSNVAPFVQSYPVMRAFIIRNAPTDDVVFPLRITITMVYTGANSVPIADPEFEIVRQLCGLTNLQICVFDLVDGSELRIFDDVLALNTYLVSRHYPAITGDSLCYSTGLNIMFRELNTVPLMDRMTWWLLDPPNYSVQDINERVFLKTFADMSAMGIWIDHIAYAFCLSINRAENATFDQMLDAIEMEVDVDAMNEYDHIIGNMAPTSDQTNVMMAPTSDQTNVMMAPTSDQICAY
jgi:hypothetical protein